MGGVPLIGLTLREISKVVKFSFEVIVSTDDIEIAKVATQFGYPVKEYRSADLAKDDTAMIDVILDIVNKNNCDFVLLLQPTSPFRKAKHIETFFLDYCIDRRVESAVSLSKVSKHPQLMFKFKDDGTIVPFLERPKVITRRQELEEIYALDGAIYWSSVKHLVEFNRFISEVTHGIELESMLPIDLDTEQDWQIAEALISGISD